MSSGRPFRILAVYRHPTPYRDPLLDRVAALPGLDLHVAYLGRTFAGTPWAPQPLAHAHSFPKGGLRFSVNDMELAVHPGLVARFLRERPDCCVLSGWVDPSILALTALCRATGVPYVIGAESWFASGRSRAPRGLRDRVVGWSVRGAAAWLPTGTRARDHLVAHGADPARCHFYPTASDAARWGELIDSHRASRPGPREELDLPADGVITFVGRLIEAKAPEVTVEAFSRLAARRPGCRLVVVGDGPLRARLEAHPAWPRVRFLGFRQPAEVARVLAATDVFVLASREEPWGAVVGEAMAGGIPAVVSERVGCAPDLVGSEGPGAIVPAEDPDAQRAAFERVLEDPERRGRSAGRARRRAVEWGHDLNLRSFVRAVRDAGAPLSPEARAAAELPLAGPDAAAGVP